MKAIEAIDVINKINTTVDEMVENKTIIVKLVGEYSDDGIGCCTIELNGNPVEMLWVGTDFACTLKYITESELAYKDFMDELKKQINNAFEELMFLNDETTPEEVIRKSNEFKILAALDLLTYDEYVNIIPTF